MKPKTLRWIIIIGVVLIVVLAIVAKTAGQNDNTKVAIDKVARHTITEVVTATGKIYPETEVKISPDVSGEVIWLGVQEGDSVQKGQTLVKINPVIYVSQVDQQDAALQQSKSGANNYNQMVAQALTQYELAQ
ncbi:MAG: biotin/lipoyl-binding protein, partial [Chitinophagia bacterium]|nr:biotin/lipoyl-binding protein [Chitinophagia bacterium]